EAASQLAVDLRFGHFDMTDEIPGAGGDKARRDDAVRVVGIQNIAGDLFAYELRIRKVFVEGSDNVVPIRPGIGARLILVVAVRIAVVRNVEPVPSPAFT